MHVFSQVKHTCTRTHTSARPFTHAHTHIQRERGRKREIFGSPKLIKTTRYRIEIEYRQRVEIYLESAYSRCTSIFTHRLRSRHLFLNLDRGLIQSKNKIYLSYIFRSLLEEYCSNVSNDCESTSTVIRFRSIDGIPIWQLNLLRGLFLISLYLSLQSLKQLSRQARCDYNILSTPRL